MRHRLASTLPQLDGAAALPGLGSAVRVEFDSFGVPTIRAADRLDAARAVGFLHAQNRFFQMDLLRRRSAGELADLIGADLLPIDRRSRIHRFREVARRSVAALSESDRALLDAYAAGVNAGLASLGAAPFEYMILRAEARPWLPEDTILVLLSMFMELNDQEGRLESDLGLMRDLLPAPLVDFLAPAGTEWDAPVTGSAVAQPPIPGPEVFDLRTEMRTSATNVPPAPGDPESDVPRQVEGSNNWAVQGSLTVNGGALLANDMHLGLSVPNTWYRASIVAPGEGGGPDPRVTGVTLPGAPVLVAGSTGRVAWGFTNSYGDWTDLVVLEIDPNDASAYLTPDGPRKFERHEETLHVRGGADETLAVESTIWGPVLDTDHLGRRRVMRWIAHDVHGINIGISRMESARTLEEAFDAAHRAGVPPQNCVVAEATGRIGWTIMGAIPRRTGFDGRFPESWADGSRRWDGWLDPDDYPSLVDPDGGRIWSANARVVDGERLRRIGDGGYDLGARARQIRDDLAAIPRARPEDLMKIQLDDRALFLERWRDLLLAELTPAALEGHPRRRELREAAEAWGAEASIGSAGYRMVRAFRLALSRDVMDALTSRCREADGRFRAGRIPQSEGPVWALLTARPPHLLDPKYGTWSDQILAAADEAIEPFRGRPLAARTWGERNRVRVEHPLLGGLPVLGRWFSMPVEPLPGDADMPRVQGIDFGASERMVVSPGHEEEGLFHMPAGQCANPLSPHFGDGHAAWAEGRPTPFLPGATASTLTLGPHLLNK
jgi:penicillin amidase